MLTIGLHNIGKRFKKEWIFKEVNYTFIAGKHCVIMGFNGSGKSTLLQVISGYVTPTQGSISFDLNGKIIPDENIYKHISIASPYLELIEEFTAKESISFQAVFKPFYSRYTVEDIIHIAHLEKDADKPVKYYSSGMKQRLKLALAILADTPLLLLDEPTSNLDRVNVQWYKDLVTQHLDKRLAIVCSNEQGDEHFFCTEQLTIEDFKPSVK